MTVPDVKSVATPFQRALAIAVIVGSFSGPLAVAYIGGRYADSASARSNDTRLIELAIGILREPPKDSTVNVRAWAVEVLEKKSGVPLNADGRRELTKSVPLPSVAAGSNTVADLKVNGSDGPVVTLRPDQSYRYSWASQGASSCLMLEPTGFLAGVTPWGASEEIKPRDYGYPVPGQDVTISLICLDASGKVSDSIVVRAAPAR
jgi:hypothetical protein